MLFSFIGGGLSLVVNPGAQTTAYVTAKAIALSSSGPPATSYVVVSGPAHGTANISGSTLTYTPANLYAGADAVTVAAIGPGGIQGPSTTISLTVNEPADPVFAPPSAIAVSSIVPSTSSVNLAPFITNPYTSIAITTAPGNGTASITGTTLSYTPTLNYAGADTIGITIYGPGTNATPATVSYNVTAVAAPVVSNTSASTAHATAVGIPITITGTWTSLVVDSISDGTYTVSGNTINYTPSGTTTAFSTTIAYHAVGPGGSSNTGTATVSVAADPYPVGATATVSVVARVKSGGGIQSVNPTNAFNLVHSAATYSTFDASADPAYGDIEGGGNFSAKSTDTVNYSTATRTTSGASGSDRVLWLSWRKSSFPSATNKHGYEIPNIGLGVAAQKWRFVSSSPASALNNTVDAPNTFSVTFQRIA